MSRQTIELEKGIHDVEFIAKSNLEGSIVSLTRHQYKVPFLIREYDLNAFLSKKIDHKETLLVNNWNKKKFSMEDEDQFALDYVNDTIGPFENNFNINEDILKVVSTNPKIPTSLKVKDILSVTIKYNVATHKEAGISIQLYQNGVEPDSSRNHFGYPGHINTGTGSFTINFSYLEPTVVDEIRVTIRHGGHKLKEIRTPIEAIWK